MKAAYRLIAVCALASSCGTGKERLAKCSAGENPVEASAYYQAERPASTNPFAIEAKRLIGHGCGPMRPVNKF